MIVPTKNSAEFIEACLKSIRDQSYRNIEMIVVDNFSKDNTQLIARKYTNKVYALGPERSAQRNYGVKKATGTYVIIIDSDMELNKDVVLQCVQKFASDVKIKALVIPEQSFGIGFWAQCKRLERSFYVGVPWMEAARAFTKASYESAGGYDESMVSGEDWDLSQKMSSRGIIDRINEFILHDEGKLQLIKSLKKKYYYAKEFKAYTTTNEGSEYLSNQTSIINRYRLFFQDPTQILKHPFIWLGMICMKTGEFAVGAVTLLDYYKHKRL